MRRVARGPCHPSSQQGCDGGGLNCSDHKPTQPLMNLPVPSRALWLVMEFDFIEHVGRLASVLGIDLSGPGSNDHGLFVLAIMAMGLVK